jgi:glutamate synthase domain-containing protein 3
MASITNANRSRAADAVCARANGGTLVIYGGTPPATADTALSGNTVAATLTMAATAFGAASNGVATAGTITAATAAANVNPATFARVFETGGTTVVFQLTVGTSGAELNLSSTNIVSGGNVAVTSLTYTQAAS